MRINNPLGGGGPHATDHEPLGADQMSIDAPAATGSLRTLGGGAQQAAAGNSGHVEDHALGGVTHIGGITAAQHGALGTIVGAHGHDDLDTVGINDHHDRDHGTTHEPGGADAMGVDAADATGSLRTLGTGAGQAGQGILAHAELHAASHEPGGGDAMAVDSVVATGSLRTLGTGAQQAAAGPHTHAGGGADVKGGRETGIADNGSRAVSFTTAFRGYTERRCCSGKHQCKSGPSASQRNLDDRVHYQHPQGARRSNGHLGRAMARLGHR